MSETPASPSKKGNERINEENDKKNRSSQKAESASESSLNVAEIRELANLIEEHGFTDFEFENEKIRIRLSKNVAPQYIQAPPMQFQSAPPQQASASPVASLTPNQTESVSSENTAAEDNLHKITSPIVGTFYSAPSPDKEPYVKEGSVVSPETTVCIVGAMKLMNEIQAEVAGEVVKIYVENGQPVEYGQPLFGIKK
ncbi:MAG TPA: acetyl-CoA carboxylase biotin carboxyl carrier protein [Pyrinomonadaceae bacterium]|nr:acetyl-CoA carboxylase biotin carboxyl carrier protein [Pyrinomonadaceae bacterium]